MQTIVTKYSEIILKINKKKIHNNSILIFITSIFINILPGIIFIW
jgi:hypothetical protein